MSHLRKRLRMESHDAFGSSYPKGSIASFQQSFHGRINAGCSEIASNNAAHESGSGSDPNTAFAGGLHDTDFAQEDLVALRTPVIELNAVETSKAVCAANPDVSVGALRNRVDERRRQAVFGGAYGLPVFSQSSTRIKRTRRQRQHESQRGEKEYPH